MSVMARLRLFAVAALAGASLTGCDDTLGPGVFDPELTAAAVDEMVVTSENLDDAWAGLALAGIVFDGTSAQALLPSDGGLLLDAEETRQLAATIEAADFFPADYLGVTFVWSEAEGSYVPSEETGAPADGIRVLYYAVDPFSGLPSEPLTVLGHIDLRDLSGASSERLGVKIERTAGTAATLADYFIDISYTATQSELAVRQVARGYLSDGTARLNFDLDGRATLTDTEIEVEQSFSMSLAGTDVSVAYDATVITDWEGENTTVSIAATVRGSGTSVRFELDASTEVLSGEVYHGNRLVATLSGSPGQPVFTNAATGEELTPAQLEALADVFRAMDGLFALAQGIFGITG